MRQLWNYYRLVLFVKASVEMGLVIFISYDFLFHIIKHNILTNTYKFLHDLSFHITKFAFLRILRSC